ncbi:GNAT family N-acetyltransferase [Planococcus sp. YIM B11945]|uniref:GNAT family N-acetyltransferase n=1 Tax=Planococcus sp. YIM B11945 TaxID=3435410 RepID=UPI003D7DE5E7
MIQFIGAEERHIRQMAALLAKRHERERKTFPFLPANFEEIDDAENVIRDLLKRPYSNGIVATRGIEVIGYLLYEFKEDAERGRYVWMDYEAIAIGEKEHPRLLRLLYADAGAEWVQHGYFHHVLKAPLGNETIVQQWLDQSFHFEQKYAILPLQQFEPQPPELESKLEFRRGTREDAPLLKKMAVWNSIHQTSAPSWLPITKETMSGIADAYEALSEDKEAFVWLAEQGERIAGFHVYFPKNEPLSLVAPANCAELPAASTNPDMRGRGVGRSLANHCFAEMKKAGFEFVYADWHTPNHLASYFWPRMGFKPVMVRMSRQIDPRIAWAKGQ